MPHNSLLLLQHEIIAVDKPAVVTEFDNPAKSGFNWRGGVINIVTIQAVSHFEPKGIACAQTNGFDTVLFPSFQNRIPQVHSIFIAAIQFETSRTGISGCRNDYVLNSGNHSCYKTIIFYLLQTNIRELLQCFFCKGPLNSQ